jgi:hypothetical protein
MRQFSMIVSMLTAAPTAAAGETRSLSPTEVSTMPTGQAIRTVIALSALAFALPVSLYADAVTVWNINANKAANATCIGPSGNALYESRLYAMTHIAIHDAVNAIERRSGPYAFDAQAVPDASFDAAVATAAHDVLLDVIGRLPADCIGTGLATVEADYAAALAAVPPGPSRTAGVEVGRAAARAILLLRQDDGSEQPIVNPGFREGTQPGEYRFTPEFPFVFLPEWGRVTPFVLKHSAQFRPEPPDDVRSKKYTADFEEVKALGGDDMTTLSTRTAEQTEIGRFWLESSPQAWNRLARTISAAQLLEPWENARLFALLNAALADGYIASWETKFHYLFWRPVTAIRLADTDGNPLTDGDPTWTPLQLTYPMPDYDSAHSVEGGVAAEILARFFGTDDISFTACSFTLLPGSTCADPGAVYRPYSSFSQAAAENSLSRIYVGIHFRKAVEEGERHGRRIAARAVRRFFRPGH